MLSSRISKFVLANLAWICGCACVCFGCRSNPPLERSEAHYAFLFGQKYRTKTDLYLFGFAQSPEPVYYIGTRANGLPYGPGELPPEITPDYRGRVFQALPGDGASDIVILDIAPAGSILTVRAETHDVTALSTVRGSGGYPMGFICELVYGGKTNSVLSEFVQSHKPVAGKVPNQDISPAVAEKIR